METVMDIKFTQWNKFGDHPLVQQNTCREFEYEESAREGCGFINVFQIVQPGSYILEVNNVFVGVISEKKYQEIMKNGI